MHPNAVSYVTNPFFLRSLVLTILLIVISIIDLRSFRIPDPLSLGGIAILLTFDLVQDGALVPARAAATLFAAGLFFLIRRFTGGLGLGDVKMAALVGYAVGPRGLPAALLVAALGGLGFAGWKALGGCWPSDRKIPFGPFLSAGAFTSLALSRFGGL